MKDYCKHCGQRKEIAGPTEQGVLCWTCYTKKYGTKLEGTLREDNYAE